MMLDCDTAGPRLHAELGQKPRIFRADEIANGQDDNDGEKAGNHVDTTLM